MSAIGVEIIVRFTCRHCGNTLEKPYRVDRLFQNQAGEAGWLAVDVDDGVEYKCDTCAAPRILCPACKRVRFRFGVSVPDYPGIKVCSSPCVPLYAIVQNSDIGNETDRIIASMKVRLHA